MTKYLHINGELIEREAAHVSALDRGFRYGDAVFETLRVYNGQPFRWEKHMNRLAGSCEAIRLEHNVSPTTLRDYAEETLNANELQEAYLRIAISRGVQPGTLTPAPAVSPTIAIQTEPLPRGGVDGTSTWDEPATCIIAETRRIPSESIPSQVKSHNYLNGILAAIEARDAGVDEAILLDPDGYLTETPTANLFGVKGNELRTPSTETLPVLPGITREEIISLATGAECAVVEGEWKPSLLVECDEVFLTNSTWEIRPVTMIDETEYPVGSVTTELQHSFNKLIESTCYARP